MTKNKAKQSQEKEYKLIEQALELLRSPDLFALYLDILTRSGLVGEERNALVLIVTGASRLLDRPLNVIVKGQSSAGKNHLVRSVLKTFPRDAIRELTSSSALAWNYAGDDFQHRIVYLQERNEASGAVHPARLLISEKCLIRKVTVNEGGSWTTKSFVTKGPIASISTTTKNQLEIDDETRHVSIWLDHSPEQTRRIVKASAVDIEPVSLRELRVWRVAHRLLAVRATCRVALPKWFPSIADLVYAADVRVRRYFPAFTTACKAIALLRSFQKRKRGKLEVEFADFAIATIIFEPVFVESMHHGSDKNLETRAAIERIAKRKNDEPVDVGELARELRISKDRAYAHLRNAETAGIIRRVNRPEKGNRKSYLPTSRPRFVPDPEKVFGRIPEVGHECEFTHPLTGETVIFRRQASRKNG